jgi:hypothetical protein
VVGQEITFIGTGHDADGSVVRYEWDFGDGSTEVWNATRSATVHTYGAPGLFVVTFRACDELGACGLFTFNLTVETGLGVTADWTGENAYIIQGPPALDPALVRVSVKPDGGAATQFAVGDGLEQLTGGAYRAALPAWTLARSKTTEVTVTYNGSVVATRVATAQPWAGSSPAASLRYHVVESEAGSWAGGLYTVDTRSTGDESWLVAGGFISHAFAGTGSSSLTIDRGQNGSQASSQTFSELAWNETWGRYDPSLTLIDTRALGTGVVEATQAGGTHTVVNLTTYDARTAGGNLTSLRANGTGYYEGGLANTFGAATLNLSTVGTETAMTGGGQMVRSLRLAENTSYTGTLGGAPYTSDNRSERLTAAEDRYFPADYFVAWNDTTTINSTTLTTSGYRYLDTDGDGDMNPDLRPAHPSDGRVFSGLVPDTLAVGDRTLLANGLGDTVVLEVASVVTQILSATGYTPAVVQVANLAGTFGDLSGQSGPGGRLTYSVVAGGQDALLWMQGGDFIVRNGLVFERAITLLGKA